MKFAFLQRRSISLIMRNAEGCSGYRLALKAASRPSGVVVEAGKTERERKREKECEQRGESKRKGEAGEKGGREEARRCGK